MFSNTNCKLFLRLDLISLSSVILLIWVFPLCQILSHSFYYKYLLKFLVNTFWKKKNLILSNLFLIVSIWHWQSTTPFYVDFSQADEMKCWKYRNKEFHSLLHLTTTHRICESESEGWKLINRISLSFRKKWMLRKRWINKLEKILFDLHQIFSHQFIFSNRAFIYSQNQSQK